MLKFVCFFAQNKHCALLVALLEKMQVPYSIAIGNMELMRECFPKHARIENQEYKGKVLYDQEPPSVESTPTEWWVNY